MRQQQERQYYILEERRKPVKHRSPLVDAEIITDYWHLVKLNAVTST